MVKTLPYLFIFILWSLGCRAAVYTVSNQPGKKADFSSIQSAIEHAAPHDTIFVMGSPINYGNVLLEKPLVLIGEGFSGQVHSGHTAKLTRVLFTSNPYRRTMSSGSAIIGFEFPFFPGQRPNIITVPDERVTIEDITIERNWLWFLEIPGSAANWVIRNNIIRGWVNGGTREDNPRSGASNFHFYNNILNSVKGFEKGELVLENNILLGRLHNIKGAQVSNNIFTREEYFLENVSDSRFLNNIAMGTHVGDEDCYTPSNRFEAQNSCAGSANRGSGNQTGLDPGFAYWPTNDIMGGTVFKLSDQSPARKAGTRGVDIGIFGGKHPFPSCAFMNPEIDDPFPNFVTSIY